MLRLFVLLLEWGTLQHCVCVAKEDLDAFQARLQNLLAAATEDGQGGGTGGAQTLEPKLRLLLIDVEAVFQAGDKSDEVRGLLAEAHYNHGVMLGKLGRASDAVVSLQRVNELFPGNADAQVTLAYMMQQAGSNDKLAIVKLLYSAAKLQPGNTNLLVQLGDAFVAAGMVDKAIEILKNVLSAARTPQPMVHASLAIAYSEAGSLQLAVNEYDLAIANTKSDEQLATLAFSRGVILEKMRRLVDAVESLTLSVQSMPDAMLPRRSLGLLLHRMGRDKEATEVFEQLLTVEEQGKRFIVHLQIAIVLKQFLGHQPDSETTQAKMQFHIERAKELSPELARPGVLMNLGLEGDATEAVDFRIHAKSSNQQLQELVSSCDEKHGSNDCFTQIHRDVLAGWDNDASCQEDVHKMILSERCWEWQLRTMERWGRLRRLLETSDDSHKHEKQGTAYLWQHCLPCNSVIDSGSSAPKFEQLQEIIASVSTGGMSWQTAWQMLLADGLVVGPGDAAEKAAEAFRTFGMVKFRNAIAKEVALGASQHLDRSASMSLPSATEYVHKPAHRVQLRMWPQESPSWSAMAAAVFGGPVGCMLESLLGADAHVLESGAFVINYGASKQSLHRDWQRGSCSNCQNACKGKESTRGECVSNEQCMECLRLYQDVDGTSHPVVTCQILLSHASADRAALFAIPLSQESSHYRSVLEPMIDRGIVKEQPVLGDAGDAVCYDVTLLHLGGAFSNSEDLTPRRIATFSFLPSDATSVPMGANFVIPNQAVGLWDIRRLRNHSANDQQPERSEL